VEIFEFSKTNRGGKREGAERCRWLAG